MSRVLAPFLLALLGPGFTAWAVAQAGAAPARWVPPLQQAYCAPTGPPEGRGLQARPLQPDPGQAAGVQWSGWIRVPVDGVYELAPAAPDLKLRVLGQPWPRAGARLHLAAGRFHAVQVSGPASRAGLASPLIWQPPAGPRASVPARHLYPSEHVAASADVVPRQPVRVVSR